MALPYELSLDADQDLQNVARYTLNNWGFLTRLFHVNFNHSWQHYTDIIC